MNPLQLEPRGETFLAAATAGAAVLPAASGAGGRMRGQAPGRQRRTSHRVPCRVRVTDESSGSATALVGETVNLSARGLAVRLARELAPGAAVEVLFPHVDGEPVVMLGRVVHTRRVLTATFEVGVEFGVELRPE